MEPKTGHSVPKQSDKVCTPPSPKKPGRRRLRSGLGGFMCKVIGVALLLSSPYIYHAIMVASYGTPIEETLLVVTPMVIYLISGFIYVRGENADAD